MDLDSFAPPAPDTDMPAPDMDMPGLSDFQQKQDDSDGEDVNTGGDNSADTKGLSKLHANIKKKGSTSYYYAHASTPPPVAPVQDSLPKPVQRPAELAKPMDKIQVETYSWSNGKKIVTIYIPLVLPPDAGEEATKLTWTVNSLELQIREKPTGMAKIFSIAKTYEEIDGVELKRKEDKLVLILKKKNPDRSWYKLAQTMV